MPRKTNHFDVRNHYDMRIRNSEGELIGDMRIKPGTVLWRKVGSHKYYSVSLDTFAQWIPNAPGVYEVWG